MPAVFLLAGKRAGQAILPASSVSSPMQKMAWWSFTSIPGDMGVMDLVCRRGPRFLGALLVRTAKVLFVTTLLDDNRTHRQGRRARGECSKLIIQLAR